MQSRSNNMISVSEFKCWWFGLLFWATCMWK